MNSFYISIITLGIIFVATALIMVVIDWKKASHERLKIDQKKKELDDTVADAEMIIEEMNKISSYIVEKIEGKVLKFNQNVEADGSLPVVDVSIKSEIINEGNTSNENAVNKGSVIDNEIEKSNTKDEENAMSKDITSEDVDITSDDINVQNETNTDDKVEFADTGINSKYNRIMLLYKKGKNIEEISRMLNMGKGEVQLVLELRGRNEKI